MSTRLDKVCGNSLGVEESKFIEVKVSLPQDAVREKARRDGIDGSDLPAIRIVDEERNEKQASWSRIGEQSSGASTFLA
jgi:hypothetical protein